MTTGSVGARSHAWVGTYKAALFRLPNTRTSVVVVAPAVLLTVAVASFGAIRPMQVILLLGGLFAVVALSRSGGDAPLVWVLVIPWQFIPGINANIMFDPWFWLALLRLLTAKRDTDHAPRKIAVAIAALLPASYLLEWLFFGVREPSLLLWMLPYVPLAISLVIVPPDPAVLRKHLFFVGVLMACLVLLESLADISLNSLIASNLSVQEYLRSDRALGTTGNPLFTSSVLIAAFFLVPRHNYMTRMAQAVILVATLLTGSKSALIGLAAGFLVLAISKGLKRFAVSTGVVLAGLICVQIAADSSAQNVFKRFAVFSDLRTSDPDRAFTTDFVLSWLQMYPFGGTPVGSALIEKRLLSPVSGGSRFGIESTWLAMAADTGILLIGLTLVLILIHVMRSRSEPAAQALFALVVSLFFWNGLFGAWIIGPLLLLLVLSPSARAMSEAQAADVTQEGSLPRWDR